MNTTPEVKRTNAMLNVIKLFSSSLILRTNSMECLSRDSLLKGRISTVQYSWPPCTNLFRSASFDIMNIMCFFYKTSYFNYFNKEENCTEPYPSVRVPWLVPYKSFRSSLIFMKEASSQPLDCDTARYSSQISFGLMCKHYIMIKRDKHSSLFDERAKFCDSHDEGNGENSCFWHSFN